MAEGKEFNDLERQFTRLNACAQDHLRLQASRAGNPCPWWLCLNDELKASARAYVVALMNQLDSPSVPYTEETVEQRLCMIEGLDSKVLIWREAELQAYHWREAGQLGAFFVS